MDIENLENKSKEYLIDLCKKNNIKGYSNKKKQDIINMIKESKESKESDTDEKDEKDEKDNKTVLDPKILFGKIQRLNYIGSKFQLLSWLNTTIKEKTGWSSFEGKRIADLFSGTGIVSYYFRMLNSIVVSNDTELFSSIISRAFNLSTYTQKCKEIIDKINSELYNCNYEGFITKNYSPYESCERKFFSVDNAMKIDFSRKYLEKYKRDLSDEEYYFILATILTSADSVSNVPAVYGCYLKNFKEKAKKDFKLVPIHTNQTSPNKHSKTFNKDILDDFIFDYFTNYKMDLVYLDPPYNERQYSKNYFPLNAIAKTPEELKDEPELKGKTGIPQDCFISTFCKKGKVIEESFEKLFKNLNTKWIFLSYNSESIIEKDRMIQLMSKYGKVSVIEKEYKRFKSFDYNKDTDIKEYLFCLEK